MATRRIGFVGAGKMGTALIQGILRAGLASPDTLIASDADASARSRLHDATGVAVTDSNATVCQSSEVVVLAVYPQVLLQVLPAIAAAITQDHLVVSIAAGITTEQILNGLGASRRVVRVMPNTPALVGCGAAAFCLAGSATDCDAEFIAEMLGGAGKAWPVQEDQLDAVTGLSGSGPAYVFTVIEALSDGGVRMGLPRALATELATQTVLGAARMVAESGRHPAQLRDQVTSPGGTTIAGMHALERGGIRAAVMNAVEAATLRSRELSRP